MPKVQLIDVGCGKNKRKGYIGIDREDFGQEHVLDVVKSDWISLFDDVDEIYCSHFIEHLTQEQILKFLDDCWAILKEGGLLHIIVPHKDAEKAYVLWHKTFFNEYTFKDLEKMGKWKITELVTNERPDIHCKLLKI